MKLKLTIPYLLIIPTIMMASGYFKESPNSKTLTNTKAQKETISAPDTVNATSDSVHTYIFDTVFLQQKADALINKYMNNMLAAQQKLKPLLGTNHYRAAVLQELPGAPVGNHCVYGQYTQLNRAIAEMGDTFAIIPPAGSRACAAFKTQMQKKYSAPEYNGAIRQGRMFQSDSLYNAALNKYLARRHIDDGTSDSVRRAATNVFATRNFCADDLAPGTILIVPQFRDGERHNHAIMYLGRGRIENGRFVADQKGRHIYTGHNRENIGDLFKTWNMSNIFAADTRRIAHVEYTKEWLRIETLPREELIDYLTIKRILVQPIIDPLPQSALMELARDKYFQNKNMQAQRRQRTI